MGFSCTRAVMDTTTVSLGSTESADISVSLPNLPCPTTMKLSYKDYSCITIHPSWHSHSCIIICYNSHLLTHEEVQELLDRDWQGYIQGYTPAIPYLYSLILSSGWNMTLWMAEGMEKGYKMEKWMLRITLWAHVDTVLLIMVSGMFWCEQHIWHVPFRCRFVHMPLIPHPFLYSGILIGNGRGIPPNIPLLISRYLYTVDS